VELPGLKRADLHIDFHDSLLTVRGQRPGQECSPERYQQLERGQGQFSRVFQISHAVRAEDMTADLAAGVLTVVIPKVSGTDAHRIDVE
jgi:HSP20 family protein